MVGLYKKFRNAYNARDVETYLSCFHEDHETHLHASGRKITMRNFDIDRTVNDLKAKNLIYEKDGATWFKATAAGRDIDRVIIKSTGEPTYRLPDIAYHRDKFDRNFDVIVDVFGADHMDAYPDVIAAIKSLDYDLSLIHISEPTRPY